MTNGPTCALRFNGKKCYNKAQGAGVVGVGVPVGTLGLPSAMLSAASVTRGLQSTHVRTLRPQNALAARETHRNTFLKRADCLRFLMSCVFSK